MASAMSAVGKGLCRISSSHVFSQYPAVDIQVLQKIQLQNTCGFQFVEKAAVPIPIPNTGIEFRQRYVSIVSQSGLHFAANKKSCWKATFSLPLTFRFFSFWFILPG